MPATESQQRANRKNAKKSTGPKTVEGKSISSRNAVTHGLRSRDVVINSKYFREDPDEYQALLDSLIEDFRPEGKFEHHLVRKIANALWRCERAAIAETACINRKIDSAHSDTASYIKLARALEGKPDVDPDGEYFSVCLQQTVASRMIPSETISATILRYEMRLDRQLARAYRLLVHHQNRRMAMSEPSATKPADENHCVGQKSPTSALRNQATKRNFLPPSFMACAEPVPHPEKTKMNKRTQFPATSHDSS